VAYKKATCTSMHINKLKAKQRFDVVKALQRGRRPSFASFPTAAIQLV
jgi:hypothetical protein